MIDSMWFGILIGVSIIIRALMGIRNLIQGKSWMGDEKPFNKNEEDNTRKYILKNKKLESVYDHDKNCKCQDCMNIRNTFEKQANAYKDNLDNKENIISKKLFKNTQLSRTSKLFEKEEKK